MGGKWGTNRGRNCSYHKCSVAASTQGLCAAHYAQQRAGRPLTDVKRIMPRGVRGIEECADVGCDRLVLKAWLCAGHYKQKASGQDPKAIRDRGPVGANDGPCAADACSNDAAARGLCSGHYEQQRLGRPLTDIRERRVGCDVDNCDSKHDAKGVCATHYSILTRFNLTAERYSDMLCEQDGGCAICGLRCASGKALAVDHDHACCPESGVSCGKCVRGLVCARHNLGLGHFNDDVGALRAAADYLDRHAARRTIAAA